MVSCQHALHPRGIMGMGPSAAYILSKARKDVQFSIVARSICIPEELRGIHLAHNDPEREGRRPKTPLPLGFRPAGTSLMSLKDGLRCVG